MENYKHTNFDYYKNGKYKKSSNGQMEEIKPKPNKNGNSSIYPNLRNVLSLVDLSEENSKPYTISNTLSDGYKINYNNVFISPPIKANPNDPYDPNNFSLKHKGMCWDKITPEQLKSLCYLV